jgi:hypothetical protein
MSYLRTILVATTALTLVTSQADAATIASVMNGGIRIISLYGDIIPGDNETFRSIINQGSYPTVVDLNSPGGELRDSLMIGEMVKSNGYYTHVGPNVVCASGCAYIWIAGVQRQVGMNAHIGFHGAFDYNKETTSDGNAVLGAYLGSLGFNFGVIAKLTAPKPDDMLWLTAELATNLGITYYFDSPSSTTTTVVRSNPSQTEVTPGDVADWASMGEWIQTASRKTVTQAIALASDIQVRFPATNVSVFMSNQSGWYVVALGPYAHAQGLRDKLVAQGDIPSDSIVRTGAHFAAFEWGNSKHWISINHSVPIS